MAKVKLITKDVATKEGTKTYRHFVLCSDNGCIKVQIKPEFADDKFNWKKLRMLCDENKED